jgi:hypothetical protein
MSNKGCVWCDAVQVPFVNTDNTVGYLTSDWMLFIYFDFIVVVSSSCCSESYKIITITTTIIILINISDDN